MVEGGGTVLDSSSEVECGDCEEVGRRGEEAPKSEGSVGAAAADELRMGGAEGDARAGSCVVLQRN